MAPPIARAENILQRADELVKMDKPNSALELLYDTIVSKRARHVSAETQGPLILKFVDLSIELCAGKNVRDALHQYKKMTVPTNTQALATVIETFLTGCRRKVAEAEATAKQTEIDEVDLEAEQSPEELLMASVYSDKKGGDREVVTRWLKFLWEGYRSVLDVLRNNNKLEDLYAKVVSEAFQFCLKYQRKTEFRRLCELLRNHLVQASQQAKQSATPQANPIDINDPETLQMLIGIRFEQLKVAVSLELWQEAFSSVENIHALFLASRRPIKISNLAIYYEMLAKICAVSNNYLFHAASLAKYYGMVYNTRETAPEGELERIASVFYLSVLCIPGDAGSKATTAQNRLTTLLNMGRVPTRDGLIAFALSKNILNFVRPEIRDLNSLLEADFHPLTLKKRLAPILEKLGKVNVFLPYVKPLLDVVVNRTLLQLAQSYTTVKIDFITEILSFAAPFNLSRLEIEKILVAANFKSTLKVRINHQKGSVTFLDTLGTNATNSIEDVLQPTPASLIRNKLQSLATCVQRTFPRVDDVEIRRVNAARKQLLDVAERGLIKEHSDFLNRKKLQEERIKAAQEQKRKQESEAAAQRAAQAEREKREEEERHAREQRQQELAIIEKEQKAAEDEKKMQIIKEIKDKVDTDLSDIDKYTFDELKDMKVAQITKEADDLRDRMRLIARKQDHHERAYRQKEAALWAQDANEQAARDRKAYNARNATLIASEKARFEQLQASYERFKRIVPAYQSYVGDILQARKAQYEETKAANDKLFEDAKKERIDAAIAKREQDAKRAKEREAALAARKEEEDKERAERELRRAATNPLGNARPINTGASSLASSGASSGAYKAPSTRPNLFGNATATTTGVDARPIPAPAPAPAAPKAPKANPFGNATATTTGASAAPAAPAAPAKTGVYRPGAFGGRRAGGSAQQKPAPKPEAEKPAAPKTNVYVPRHR